MVNINDYDAYKSTRNFGVRGNAIASELLDLYGSVAAYKPKKSKKQDTVKIYGKNCLEVQLGMSVDIVVNKMIYYLSKLPVQLSVFELTPMFKELIKYSRFEGYIDKLFDSTE